MIFFYHAPFFLETKIDSLSIIILEVVVVAVVVAAVVMEVVVVEVWPAGGMGRRLLR